MSIFGWRRPARHLAARFGVRVRNGTEPGSRGGAARRIRASIWGRQRGCATASKDLEGEPSPGRTGPLPTPATARRSPDSIAEQGLEGGARRESGEPNTKEATATVTWCGCRRGSSFEGYETDVAGKAAIESGRAFGPCDPSRRRRKRDEPQDGQRDETSPRNDRRRKPPRW
jgi:hypothetical protein